MEWFLVWMLILAVIYRVVYYIMKKQRAKKQSVKQEPCNDNLNFEQTVSGMTMEQKNVSSQPKQEGTKPTEVYICDKCGTEYTTDVKFCRNCSGCPKLRE
ncbi:MAG: hypothetical protein IKT68_01835 [Clostridia bacterium]|nr:hypothetical protein [Clostridia bacterium]